MTVTTQFDRDIRECIAAEFDLAQTLVDLDVRDEHVDVWRLSPRSAAGDDARVVTNMFPYLPTEIQSNEAGINLPLTQARSLLVDAAATLKALGQLVTGADARVRFAATAPLARSCTERASTVVWVIGGTDRDQRLRRSLLVEIRGLEHLLSYLPSIRSEPYAGDLQAMKTRLLEIASNEAGGYKLDRRGALLSVGGEARSSYTDLVSNATAEYSYAELSVHTHPTGHLHVASSEWSSGRDGQACFSARSTVHDEGRLCEPAVLSFSRALVAVGDYIAVPRDHVFNWARRVADAWRTWCAANGCA